MRRSPTCCNIAPAAAVSGASESSDGTETVAATGPEPVTEAGRAGFGSGPVAASSTWRLIRAAGSEAERARSHVAAVASARATLSARRVGDWSRESRPAIERCVMQHDRWAVPLRSVDGSIQQRKSDARWLPPTAAIAASVAGIGDREVRA